MSVREVILKDDTLLHSRLLLVLQCCVRLSDSVSGQKPTTLPLTLGSAIKKFSRRIKQDHSTMRDIKEGVSQCQWCSCKPCFGH